MTDSTHPFFVIYIVWHPKFKDGESIAKVLYDHYRRDTACFTWVYLPWYPISFRRS